MKADNKAEYWKFDLVVGGVVCNRHDTCRRRDLAVGGVVCKRHDTCRRCDFVVLQKYFA